VARAALAYGFETLGLDLIFAITLPDNLASQAMMKRITTDIRRGRCAGDIARPPHTCIPLADSLYRVGRSPAES